MSHGPELGPRGPLSLIVLPFLVMCEVAENSQSLEDARYGGENKSGSSHGH